MSTFRFLLVDPDGGPETRSRLRFEGDHEILSAGSLAEASEAVLIQRFDAVLLNLPETFDGIAEFANGLRTLERSQKSSTRTPILLICETIGGSAGSGAGSDVERGIDGVLPTCFDAHTLIEVLNRVSETSRKGAKLSAEPSTMLAVFEPEEFWEQMGSDAELVVEIIDLFFVESAKQMAELRQSLEERDLEQVSRLAHTLKGSVSSLRAPHARFLAGRLEYAARDWSFERACLHLEELEDAVAVLRPALVRMRDFGRQPAL